LGADFFLRQLLDADAASNTLSWRWVAGLQTPGETYLATAENIARYTHGRFAPVGLATEAIAFTEAPPGPPARDDLPRLAPGLAAEGITMVQVRRDSDERFWRHATKGFFAFRERIPWIWSEQGLA